MAFSLGKFVRHTPTPALRAYFAVRKIDFANAVDWSADEKTIGKTVVGAVEQLPDAAREAIYTEFEQVEQLSDEVGGRAILCALGQPLWAQLGFDAMEGGRERALRLLLNDDQAFRRAEEIRFSDYHRNSRLWDGFLAPKGLTISQGTTGRAAFRDELQRVLRRTDGSGRTLELEVFTRAGPNGADPLSQLTVYAEGIPESVVEFANGGLDRRVQRPAIELAMTYAPASGAIDVIAKGGKQVREQLARRFLRGLLRAPDADVEALPLRRYELQRLARPMHFPTDPADGIKAVRVIGLGLTPHGGPGKVTLEVPRSAPETIYELSGQWFGRHDPLRSGFRVRHAKLAVEFHPQLGARRGKVLAVELTAPHRCNLKDRTRFERLIGEKYLERWELLAAV